MHNFQFEGVHSPDTSTSLVILTAACNKTALSPAVHQAVEFVFRFNQQSVGHDSDTHRPTALMGRVCRPHEAYVTENRNGIQHSIPYVIQYGIQHGKQIGPRGGGGLQRLRLSDTHTTHIIHPPGGPPVFLVSISISSKIPTRQCASKAAYLIWSGVNGLVK